MPTATSFWASSSRARCERDFTVPVASACFLAGYVVVAVAAASLAGTSGTAPSMGRVLAGSVLLCAALAVPAIASASGRAAIWLARLDAVVLCNQQLINQAGDRRTNHILLARWQNHTRRERETVNGCGLVQFL